MDDFPQDELANPSFYITPSSSALAALSSLNPPSPILTPSQLTFTWSSGDIPVVLFDDAYALDGRTLTHAPTTAVSIRNRDSYASSTGTSIRTPGFNRAQVLSHRYSVGSQDHIDSFHSSGSSNTLASVGTFGPRRMNLKSYCHTRPISTGTSVPEISSSALRTVDYGRRGTLYHTRRSSGGKTPPDDNIALVALTSQGSSETLKGLAPRLSLSSNDKTIALSSLRTRLSDSTSWEHRAYELPKIPETPSPAASNRTASWIQSHELSSPAKQSHGCPENISPVNPASTDRKQTLISPVTPTRCNILTDQDVNLVTSSSPQHRRKSTHQVDTSHPKHFRQPKEDFSWIRDITVQCLVDQEGFRAAQPSFKLSGIVHLRSSLEPQTPGPATAQFRPIARQSFHFHHAAFEPPPTLRRVSINDQETHDYVSRQAHLTLKCNGVYVVHGQEISSVEHDGQAQKLSWQFEYLVDDRRVDHISGRVIEGEKIFTPLTFSCSPELLLPAQGKRVNIMHVFKKSVAPKLYAEKFQPPGTPNGRLESPGKTHGWSLHRRVQSHGTRHKDGHETVNSRVGIHSRTNSHRTRTAIENVNEDEFGRHRRASSVGDHSQAANYSSIILRNRRHDSPIKDTVQPLTLPHPTRHIIPPSRLTELFDSAELSQPVPASICEPSTFTSLTPRPRSRHAWGGKPEDFSRS